MFGDEPEPRKKSKTRIRKRGRARGVVHESKLVLSHIDAERHMDDDSDGKYVTFSFQCMGVRPELAEIGEAEELEGDLNVRIFQEPGEEDRTLDLGVSAKEAWTVLQHHLKQFVEYTEYVLGEDQATVQQ